VNYIDDVYGDVFVKTTKRGHLFVGVAARRADRAVLVNDSEWFGQG
jgi:hypothetical protein